MKRVRSTKGNLEFQLERWEGPMLAAVLDRYPCLPLAHQVLSKGGQAPDPRADQQLLNEALADQRRENKKQLDLLLADPARFREKEAGWRLSLAQSDLEWLLQVLNDIRVGSWARLGSPEDLDDLRNDQADPDVGVMELAGYFQMRFLSGLRLPSADGPTG